MTSTKIGAFTVTLVNGLPVAKFTEPFARHFQCRFCKEIAVDNQSERFWHEGCQWVEGGRA